MAIHTNFCYLKEDSEVYAKCHEILGLPDTVEWSKLTVEFGTGDFSNVTLVLIPSGEQVAALAELAIMRVQDNCASDDAGYAHSDMPDEEHLEEALLDAARSTIHSDPDMGPAG